MKNWIVLLISMNLLLACNNSSQQISADENGVEFFGEKITPEGAISSESFFETFTEGDSVEMKVSGQINEVCKKKGCWMSMKIGTDEEMMVRFKDYGFFVPLNADGRNTIVEGWAYKEVMSVDELKHYAFDAGQTEEEIAAITEPEVSYTFMAHGVIIE